MRGKGAGHLQSVDRAMRVLDHIAGSADPVAARDVADATPPRSAS